MCNGPLRSSKVVDFGTNRKRVCDFLFVINSNLGPILPHFRDIAGFLLKTARHPHPTRILDVFPLDKIADVVAPRSEDPKLIIRVINFELIQPMYSRYLNVTDGQTDGRTTYDNNTALCIIRASRGKNTVRMRIVEQFAIAICST